MKTSSSYLMLLPIFLYFVGNTSIAAAPVVPSPIAPLDARAQLEKRSIPFYDENFLRYAKNGNDQIVRLFIDAGVDLEVENSQGETALVLASQKGHDSTVKLLLKAGANPLPLANSLHEASGRRDVSQVAFNFSGVLLTFMGGLFTYFYNRRTKQIQELETIEKLLPHLDLADEKRQERRTAALVAIAHLATPELAARFAAIYPGPGSTLACIELLRSEKLKDKSILEQALPRLLTRAAETGDEPTVRLLLGSFGQGPVKLPVDARDENGRTALMWSARNNHVGIMDRLLEAEAKIDLIDKDGETALHLAAKQGYPDAVGTLLVAAQRLETEARNQFLGAKDKRDRSALDRAIETNNHQIIELLKGESSSSRAPEPHNPGLNRTAPLRGATG